MSYESIAELIHDLVKNPESMSAMEQGLSCTKLKTDEVTIIRNVFSRYEVSGDVLTIGMIPGGMWG